MPSELRPLWLWFDLDDTLWDFRSNSAAALRVTFDTQADLNTRFESYDDFAALYHSVNDGLWRQYAMGAIDAPTLKTERFRRVLGLPVNEETHSICRVLNKSYLDVLARQTGLVKGAVATLAALSRRHMIGVLSNGFADTQYLKLYHTPLWRYVTRMVISDETGTPKPDVRLYRHAAQAVGAVPERCVMIGDNPDTDIAGARKAGWRTVHYDPKGRGDISSLPELIPIFLP